MCIVVFLMCQPHVLCLTFFIQTLRQSPTVYYSCFAVFQQLFPTTTTTTVGAVFGSAAPVARHKAQLYAGGFGRGGICKRFFWALNVPLNCTPFVQDIRCGLLGTRRASVVYGIPRSTLRNKIYKLEAAEDNGDGSSKRRRLNAFAMQKRERFIILYFNFRIPFV